MDGNDKTARARVSASLIHASGLKDLPPPEWLIDQKVPRRGIGVVYGQPGSGKTFYFLDQLLTIAQTHPVIYAPTEGIYGLYNRLAALCDYRKLDLGKLFIYEKPVQLMNSPSVKAFIKEVRAVGPVVVTFDTLNGCMVGGDENAPRDMGNFVNGCQKVSRELDCFTQVGHHTPRKGNNERGHSSLRGAADIMVSIECNGHRVTVRCTKSKDSEPFPVERYTLSSHLNSMVLKPDGALSIDQLAILNIIADNPGIKPAAITAKGSVSESTVHRILRELKRHLLVTVTSSYFITSKGEKTAAGRATVTSI
jgi:hypothetical protein